MEYHSLSSLWYDKDSLLEGVKSILSAKLNDTHHLIFFLKHLFSAHGYIYCVFSCFPMEMWQCHEKGTFEQP